MLRHIFNLLLVMPLLAAAEPISFRNDVMAILSKSGCNAGACHGNANGKGGFKLSLRGESPDLDFAALTHDQFARRIDLIAPEESLILAKATTQLAHEGGQRFPTNSWPYHALVDWIGQGASNDSAFARTLVKLDVSPAESFLVEPQTNLQISARAVFSDGTTRDVTDLAVYESANPIVTITPGGLVRADQPGETTVLVRYLNQQIPVRLAFIPARPDFAWARPRPNNFVDDAIFTKLERLRTNPSDLCGDEVFVRRAYLDVLGLIPPAAEARAFVFDPSATKRRRLVNELLERPEFADFWALKWADLLRAEERIMDRKGIELLYRWIRQSIYEHKPLDQFAREIIAARGSTYKNPPANFYRATRTPVERAEAAAQVFMGTRVQCAQCHNHPFDRWSQDDYYDWLSVFSRVQYKVLENRRRDDNDSHEFKGEQIVFMGQTGDVKNPRTGTSAQPRFLGETKRFTASGDQEDELTALAEWATAPQNPFFAKVQVNRIWFHLMGRGLVEPVDDFRASNPPSHPELIEALARDFIDHGFDLRQTIRVIMNSRTYQLSSTPNDTNLSDESNFSRSLVRRLTAEQLIDSQSRALGLPIRLAGYPVGTRAAQMAGALPERRRGGGGAEVDQFLAIFGKPPRLLPSECERSCEPTMGQAFQMMNGPMLNDLLGSNENCLAALSNVKSDEELLDELWWKCLSRPPASAELTSTRHHLASSKERRAALEDIAWSLLNSKEFLFR